MRDTAVTSRGSETYSQSSRLPSFDSVAEGRGRLEPPTSVLSRRERRSVEYATASDVTRTWVVGTFTSAFTCPTSTLLTVADLIVRVALGALGFSSSMTPCGGETVGSLASRWAAGGSGNRRMLKPSTASLLECLAL